MKQTFEIPEGCKVVTVEQIGNQLITSFETEKYVPKVGDCVRLWYRKEDLPVYCLIDSIDGRKLFAKNVWIENNDGDKLSVAFENSNFVYYKSIEKITPEEFQAEFEKLGYVYDFKTHTAHKKQWRAKDGEDYYFVTGIFEIQASTDIRHRTDDLRHKLGNYFENEEDAEVYRDYMFQHSQNFHKK